jgi:hypothetical protein
MRTGFAPTNGITNINRTGLALRRHAAIGGLAIALGAVSAYATPTVTIDSVAQRWPWNNKVDITYTVGDGTDLAAFKYYKVVFNATIDGTIYSIDGSKDVIAKTTTGTYTVTWTNAPSGVRTTGCKMGAKLYETSAYYMIVDLDTGNFAFDGLEGTDTPTAVPTASNARYNTDLYKTDRLVLRRVPRTSAPGSAYSAGYPTGHSDYTYNQPTNWITAADYFIGVFDMTIAQYAKIMGLAASSSKVPKNTISWNTLRASKEPATTLDSSATSGSVFERLNALAGLRGFDLPTSVMHEIAERAGVTGRYWWNGNNTDWGYSQVDTTLYTGTWDQQFLSNPGYSKDKQAVGSTKSNLWGLFDSAGNVRKLLRDGAALYSTDLNAVADAFTPAAFASGGTGALVRGGGVKLASSDASFRASKRETWNRGSGHDQFGFRASFVNVAQ